VMYAAAGAGYAVTAALTGAVQHAASPSAAILAGAGLTLILTAASASRELVSQRRRAATSRRRERCSWPVTARPAL
jgi:hypothetical protein